MKFKQRMCRKEIGDIFNKFMVMVTKDIDQKILPRPILFVHSLDDKAIHHLSFKQYQFFFYYFEIELVRNNALTFYPYMFILHRMNFE